MQHMRLWDRMSLEEHPNSRFVISLQEGNDDGRKRRKREAH